MSDIAIRVEHLSKRYRLGQPERSSAPLQPFRCHLPSGLSQFAMFSLLPPGLSPFAMFLLLPSGLSRFAFERTSHLAPRTVRRFRIPNFAFRIG